MPVTAFEYGKRLLYAAVTWWMYGAKATKTQLSSDAEVQSFVSTQSLELFTGLQSMWSFTPEATRFLTATPCSSLPLVLSKLDLFTGPFLSGDVVVGWERTTGLNAVFVVGPYLIVPLRDCVRFDTRPPVHSAIDQRWSGFAFRSHKRALRSMRVVPATVDIISSMMYVLGGRFSYPPCRIGTFLSSLQSDKKEFGSCLPISNFSSAWRMAALMTSLLPYVSFNLVNASIYAASPPPSPCTTSAHSPLRWRLRIASFSTGALAVSWINARKRSIQVNHWSKSLNSAFIVERAHLAVRCSSPITPQIKITGSSSPQDN